MWLPILVALAVFANGVSSKCVCMFEPLNKTIVRLEISEPVTWVAAYRQCHSQYHGFEVLGRDFLGLNEAERALCGKQQVPLSLGRRGLESIAWVRWFMSEPSMKEKVNDTYLAHKRNTSMPNGKWDFQIGSFEPTTNLWHLVENSVTFTCVICQRAWIESLEELNIEKEYRSGYDGALRASAYTFEMIKIAKDNFTVELAINQAEEYFEEEKNIEVDITNLGKTSGKSNGFAVRLLAFEYEPLSADNVSQALNGSYIIKGWQDKDKCPAIRTNGIDWKETYRGNANQVRLPQYLVAVKFCLDYTYKINEDFDAVWDTSHFLYVDRNEECIKLSFTEFVNQLKNFSTLPASGLNLKSMVKIMENATELMWLPGKFYTTRSNISNGIFRALSAVLNAVSNETDADSHVSLTCMGTSCGFITIGSTAPVNMKFTINSTIMTFLNTSNADYNHFNISLQVPTAGSIGLHTMSGDGYGKSIFLNGPYESDQIVSPNGRDLVAVIHFLATTSTETNKPEKIIFTFQIINVMAGDFRRYLAVWRLGENKQSTKLCPLVRREVTVDTYECCVFIDGPQEVTGSFLAITGPRFDFTYDVYIRLITTVFEGYVTMPITEPVLQVLANLTKDVIDIGYGTWGFERETVDRKTFFSFILRALLINQINVREMVAEEFRRTYQYVQQQLEDIVSNMILEESVATASQSFVKILVSNLTVTDPVIGVSLGKLSDASAIQTISASERHSLTSETAVDFILGTEMAAGHGCRLQMLAFSELLDSDTSSSAFFVSKLMVLYMVVTSSIDMEESNMYLDIQLPSKRDEMGVILINDTYRKLSVATWSKAESDWIVTECTKLRLMRNTKRVFRCDRLGFVAHKFRGRYLIFEPSRFVDALGSILVCILIIAGVLSGIGVLSIVVTAASLAIWRQNLNHKILLQMTLALSFNLALGFTSNLVSLDTASVACFVVGALRHFSYLAMFAWMLVMSCLQVRRMLSSRGSRTTTNLLLKVSVMAWGLPIIAVAVMIYFRSEMYFSDSADRGFCYPEGVTFVWTVQVPAGTVLSLNGIIFLVILARLYGLGGWGKMEGLRRHRNKRTFHLHRLKTVFFMFCLFGMSWAFHLLAELGIFQMKYVYEYLFLMTASIHVLLLSCIFVLFDKKTRGAWFKLIVSKRARASANTRYTKKMQGFNQTITGNQTTKL